MYFFSNLKPVCCSTSCSNCSFLTCIHVSQEAGQVLWYCHLFKNFPVFVVIYTVKGFSIVSNPEGDVFLEFSCFFCDLIDVDNLISSSSAFSESSLSIWKFSIHVLLKPTSTVHTPSLYIYNKQSTMLFSNDLCWIESFKLWKPYVCVLKALSLSEDSFRWAEGIRMNVSYILTRKHEHTFGKAKRSHSNN